MKRHAPRSRVSAIAAVGAVMATAGTIGIAVVLPAKTGGTADAGALARAGDAKQPTEVAIIPSRIDVIGFRTERSIIEPTLADPQARARKS